MVVLVTSAHKDKLEHCSSVKGLLFVLQGCLLIGVSHSDHPKWLKEVMERERKVSQEMEEA